MLRWWRSVVRRAVDRERPPSSAPGSTGLTPAGPGGDDGLARVRQREQQLVQAQSIARIGSWEWEVATDTLTWSDQLFVMFGVDSATYRPTRVRFLDLLHPDDRETAREVMLAALDQVSDFAFAGRVPDPDGAPPTWVRVRGAAVPGPDGRTVRLAGTVQDVTESKEHENALAFLSVMASAAKPARCALSTSCPGESVPSEAVVCVCRSIMRMGRETLYPTGSSHGKGKPAALWSADQLPWMPQTAHFKLEIRAVRRRRQAPGPEFAVLQREEDGAVSGLPRLQFHRHQHDR